MVKIFNLGLLVISLLLIISGFVYTPNYFSDVFFSTGEDTGFGNIVLVVDILLICSGIVVFMLRRKIARRKKHFVLLFITMLICLVVIELGLRGYIYFSAQSGNANPYIDLISDNPLFEKHPYLNYIPAKNYRSLDGLNMHNSLGFRGEEIGSKDKYRIVALGGSTTYSTGVKDWTKSYPEQLEQILNQEGFDVEVINAGVMSYDSWESLINLQLRVLELEPDLVIVYHGLNDVNSRMVNPNYYLSDNTGRRKQWEAPETPWFFELAIFRIPFTVSTGKSLVPAMDQYNTAPTAAPGVLSSGFNERLGMTPLEALEKNLPIYYDRNLRNMVAIVEANDFDIMFATFAYSNEHGDYITSEHYQKGIAEHNEVMKSVGNDLGIKVYDFAKDMPEDIEYWTDGRHVNEEGARLKAELFAEFIINNFLEQGIQER